jgi:hypothetical protein
VTVIATGIGKRLDAPAADLGVWAPGQPHQPEDLEIPTILRQATPEPTPARAAEGRPPEKRSFGVIGQKKNIVHPDLQYEENELDIPPFLRKEQG